MRTGKPPDVRAWSLRWSVAVLAVVVALVLPARADAQGGFTASLGLDTSALPAGFTGTFQPGAPIPLALKLNGPTSGVTTFQGFKNQEFLLLMRVTDGAGNVTNPDTLHWDFNTFSCSAVTVGGSVQLLPTAVLVAPAEAVTFPLGETIADITALFPVLAKPGGYVLQLVIPIKTWNPSAPNQVFTNCLGLPPGTFVNVGQGGGTDIAVRSNGLHITRCCFANLVFLPPLDNTATRNVNGGSVVPVKFQLLNPDGTPIRTASATLSVQHGSDVPQKLGAFQLNSGGTYSFSWDTSGFARGQWQVEVLLDDGTVHVATVNIR
jgi:hypothetical protein